MEKIFEIYRVCTKTNETIRIQNNLIREVALNFVDRLNTEVNENRFKYYAIKEGTQLPKQLKIPFIYENK